MVLNGQYLSWTNVEAKVPKGSIIRPLLILICINDLSDGLTLNPKLFVDDASLIAVAQNKNSSEKDLNTDLMKINDWAFQWKMIFNRTLKNKFKYRN